MLAIFFGNRGDGVGQPAASPGTVLEPFGKALAEEESGNCRRSRRRNAGGNSNSPTKSESAKPTTLKRS